jgi:hypothetical protein
MIKSANTYSAMSRSTPTAEGLIQNFRELERKEDDLTKLRLALKIKKLRAKLKLAKEIDALHQDASKDKDDDDEDEDDGHDDDVQASLSELSLNDYIKKRIGQITDTSELPSLPSTASTSPVGRVRRNSAKSRGAHSR